MRSAIVALLALGACAATEPAEFVDLGGNSHRPAVVDDAAAHVLFFITVDCPIANQYVPEINSITDDYAGKGIRFFCVHVDPDLTAAIAKKHAAEYGLKPAVVLDPKHELVAATGVTVTPEAVVLTPGGMPYRGRIDNLYADLGDKRRVVTRHELRDALAAVLSGKPILRPRTAAVGCFIPDQP